MLIVYWSSKSETTHRFVQKLNSENIRLPLNGTSELLVKQPFVLILPSYGSTVQTALPKAVIDFLSKPTNRESMKGVIGAGNTDFGRSYCIAAKVIAHQYQVPLWYKFELSGTALDVAEVVKIIHPQGTFQNGQNS